MGKFIKLHWVAYCILVFILSRIIMLYQFNIANDILAHVHSNFFTAMCKWDCKWYLTIINDGYDLHLRSAPKVWRGLANWAFFPLYPLIVKFCVLLTKASPLIVGNLINQFFILISLHIFYLYLKLFLNELNSRFGVFLIAFSPFSVYFASLYTEALFLLLSITAFYFMRTKRPYLSALCGGLLSATRPVGIMFSIPFLYFQSKKLFSFNGFNIDSLNFNKISSNKSSSNELNFNLPNVNQINLKDVKLFNFKQFSLTTVVIGTIISASGLMCYMFYLYVHVGDALAFHHIQHAWGRTGFNTRHIGQQLLRMALDYHNSVLFLFSVYLSIYLIVINL